MCWAFDLVDPWGNQYELNCYDYDRVRAELVEADAVKVVRYWPRELYDGYRGRHRRSGARTSAAAAEMSLGNERDDDCDA